MTENEIIDEIIDEILDEIERQELIRGLARLTLRLEALIEDKE